jgi:hypothetical protein
MAEKVSPRRRRLADGFRRLRKQSGVKRSPTTSLSSGSLSMVEARQLSATASSD